MNANDTNNFRDRLKNLHEAPPPGAWDSIAQKIAPVPLAWWQKPWASWSLAVLWAIVMVWLWPSTSVPQWAINNDTLVMNLEKKCDVIKEKKEQKAISNDVLAGKGEKEISENGEIGKGQLAKDKKGQLAISNEEGIGKEQLAMGKNGENDQKEISKN
jgi:hypothetical protein